MKPKALHSKSQLRVEQRTFNRFGALEPQYSPNYLRLLDSNALDPKP